MPATAALLLVGATLALLLIAGALGPSLSWPEEAMVWMGASAAFALLHLALFAFYPEERANLYLALSAGAFVAVQAVDVLIAEASEPAVQGLLGAAINTAGIVMALSALRFSYAVFGYRTSRVFHGLLAVGGLLVAWLWLDPPSRPQPPALVMVLALASVAELLRTVLRAFRERRAGSRLIGLGFLVFGVTAAVQSAAILLTPYRLALFPYGMLFLLLILSVSLARRFAETTRDLGEQLERVRELSAEALEQERRARSQEVRRKLVEAENERRGLELERARRLQLSLLPTETPEVPGWELAASMATATEVGGDYYDFRSDDGRLTVAVGDATGHGLDAGLVVAATKSLFRSAPGAESPAALLDAVSRGIRGLGLRRMNMALTLATADGGAATGRVRLIAAGMPPPLVWRGAAGAVEEVRLQGPPLGTLAGYRYSELSVELATGDLLLIYTDGLPEARDPEDRMLGYERLAERFAALAAAGAPGLVSGLMEAADGWAAGRGAEDDVTLVALRRRL